MQLFLNNEQWRIILKNSIKWEQRSMEYLDIIIGITGSGKSYFSKEIARRLKKLY